MSYKCPKCNGVIYIRRNKICGYCGAELPPELLFSAAEIETMDKEAAVLAEFHKKQKAELDAEDLERKDAARRQAESVAAMIAGGFL
jgi:hypothetical protein